MARSTPLVILIKNIYTLWGTTYFPTNLVYPFTLQVTGIKDKRKRYSRYPCEGVREGWRYAKNDFAIFTNTPSL